MKPPKTIIFDLDDTLYPADSGVWDLIGLRIDDFIRGHLQIPDREIPVLREELYLQYGTTLRGLQILHGIDPHEYLDFVHQVPLSQYLKQDPELRAVLQNIKHPKVIFTNSDRAHSNRVIAHLGLEGCFDQIVDVLDVAPYCKPLPEAFYILLEKLGGAAPQDCILFEDSRRNLKTAKEIGFLTVLVGNTSNQDGFHAAIPSLVHLEEIIQELIEEK